MDTNNLRYFAAVAKYGSITQAAKAAYISQPQLSHIIRQLEKEMGLTLFRRTSHGTKLTVDGQRILLHCQVILKEMDRLQNMVNAHRIEKSCLNVSMTRFSHTAECYNEICRRYQDIDSFTGRLCEGATLDVVQDVKENRSNIGILHMAGKEADDLARNFEEQGLIYEPLPPFGLMYAFPRNMNSSAPLDAMVSTSENLSTTALSATLASMRILSII